MKFSVIANHQIDRPNYHIGLVAELTTMLFIMTSTLSQILNPLDFWCLRLSIMNCNQVLVNN